MRLPLNNQNIMKHINIILLFSFFCSLQSFAQSTYFPPTSGNTWETTDPASLGWCTDQIPNLYNYLETSNSKGFLVLKDGKIVMEKYFGTFTQDSSWYWASAGKSLTAFLIGQAQQQGLLNIEDRASKYLGEGWTSCTPEQEEKILIRHMLTMTSGIDDDVADQFCDEPQCLKYKVEPGTRWAYHTAVYGLLLDIIEDVTGKNINQFLNQYTAIPIGMKGLWTSSGYGELYFTNVRSMARYGHLILNNGIWDGNDLIKDPDYFSDMINTSQQLNKSYGYLWWLNGKSSFKVPGPQIDFPGSLIPNAPDDMIMALGKNGQIICVVPSQNMVLIRMGNAPDGSGDLVTPAYLREIWAELNKVICSTTSTKNLSKEISFDIFPNPVGNVLIIELSKIESNSTNNLIINDISGRKISSHELTETFININTEDLIPGIYFVNLMSKEGNSIAVRSFVKK